MFNRRMISASKSSVGVMEFSGIVEGKPIGSEWNKFKQDKMLNDEKNACAFLQKTHPL